jgi:diguanylate cyclase (GGDEF)-like protein
MVHRVPADELRQAFLSLPVSVCLLDRQARYIAANRRYADLCDALPEGFFGKSMLDFCPADMVAKARQDFELFDTGEAIPDREIVFAGRNLLVAVNPIARDADTSVAAIAVALTDISAQKKLETALAVANDNLFAAYKEIRIFAETDALTRLTNRYGLEKFCELEIRRCRRELHPIAVAIVDVDCFKPYNDRHGHIAGDESLKAVAGAIQSAIRRPGDCAARYGGDEFVVVLPNTTLAGAEHVGRTIQRAVAGLAIRNGDGPFNRLTVSIGIAGLTVIPRDIPPTAIRDCLMRSADKALYAGKDSGRNGLVVWNDKL